MSVLIMDRMEPFKGKVNFIDSNNVVVGFDMQSCCCECYEWFIFEKSGKVDRQILRGDDTTDELLKHLDFYNFDPNYMVKHEDGRDDSGGRATFKLVRPKPYGAKDTPPDLFLTIVNAHNGYYCHGFTFSGPSMISDAL